MMAVLRLAVLILLSSLPAVRVVSELDTGSVERLAVACNSSEVQVFNCNETGCVATSRVCNGIPDCADGSDESVSQCGCLPNEFRCSNSCVDLVRRCDRVHDCSDGKDEEDCESFVCPATHFKCFNHFCVPVDKVCNFEDDCGDGSDEHECNRRKCWHQEFTCTNQECIRPGFLCDGVQDCKDGSDETDCAPERFVRCGDGSLLHRYYACDGWPDCSDNHADELHCRDCNETTMFLCPNGRCIRRANLCDSICDCLPSTENNINYNLLECADEINCDGHYGDVHGVLKCDSNTTLTCGVPGQNRRRDRCIDRQHICDGENDCHNGNYFSDEYGCPDNMDSSYKGPAFTCTDNRSLPLSLKCDFKPDCFDGEDETLCDFVPCAESEFQCQNGECIPLSSKCDLIFDCWDKSDELECGSVPCQPGYRKCVRSGQCVQESLWCDYIPDCPDFSDESDCGDMQNRACGPDEFRCDNGQCVSSRMRCYNSGIQREGCADGTHLVNCREWPCYNGSFKCRNGPCLNRSLLCDGNIDCVGTWVDEDGCPFPCSSDEPRCECRDTLINCTGQQLKKIPADIEKEITWFHMADNFLNSSLDKDTFVHLDRVLYLDLSNNSISHIPAQLFRNQWRLQILNLQRNLLVALVNNSFYGLPNLRALHLQGNSIRVLEPFAFYGLSSLTTLDLSHQEISNISQGSFVGLRSLISLDLSFNKITIVRDGSFNGLPHLLSLDLGGNYIKIIGDNAFRSMPSLEKLVTNAFRFCCLARQTTACFPPPDEFSSCEDLMSNLVLRVCIWVLGTVATCGNVLVIMWRAKFAHKNQVHSFLITNLALGDMFMGSYLLIIASVDAFYRGVYFIHDSSWRSSSLCNIAGFISTFSSELSVFTLTVSEDMSSSKLLIFFIVVVITLDRFIAIIFPFKVKRLQMRETKILMAAVWIAAAILSGLPLVKMEYFQNFYGRSGVCLALHITAEKPSGWEYSVFVFLFLNLLSFAIIAVGYLWMYVAAQTTQQAVQKAQKCSDSVMARKMTLIVATDAACWMPIILLGFVSLSGITVPPQVFAWVAVFVLPLNAAVNPVLYTLSTAPFTGPARKRLTTFTSSFKLSLSSEQRRTYTSQTGSSFSRKHSEYNINNHSGSFHRTKQARGYYRNLRFADASGATSPHVDINFAARECKRVSLRTISADCGD